MDRIVAGGLAGLVSGIILGLITTVLSLLGFCKLCLIAIGGGIFVRQILKSPIPIGWMMIGWLNHLIVSVALGIVLAYILTYMGKEYAVLKGAFFGAVVWYLLIGIFAPLAGYLPPSPEPLELFIVFGYHVFFGGLAAYLTTRLSSLQVK